MTLAVMMRTSPGYTWPTLEISGPPTLLCSPCPSPQSLRGPVQGVRSQLHGTDNMTAISFDDGTIQIDAAIVAKGLGMDAETLRMQMRVGAVTSTCEKGEGKDAGRYRVTFYSASRRLRVAFDAAGQVLQTSSADHSRKARPTTAA